jgi:hypothetical protein
VIRTPLPGVSHGEIAKGAASASSRFVVDSVTVVRTPYLVAYRLPR